MNVPPVMRSSELERAAAPAGGAWKRGRGCSFIALGLTLIFAPAAAPADSQILSSGLRVALHDVIDEQPLYRVRFVAPQIGADGADFLSVAEDMEILCQETALPLLTAQGFVPERIVIALMQEPVEFGVMSPKITQFFESYLIENDLCIWELF